MKMKKTLAFLTGLALVLPNAALTAFAAEESMQDTALTETEIGTTDAVPHLYEAPPQTQQKVLLPDTEKQELPASYDLRKEGLVSAVRNQGSLGTCWAHATLGCIENDQIADHPYIDLSERYLATFMISSEYGDGSDDFMRGSSAEDALCLLSNWIGAVDESVAPYDEEYVNTLSREGLQQQSEYHITDSRCYSFSGNTIHDPDDPDNIALMQSIKQEICNGNALYISLNFDEEGAVNPETFALNNDRMGDHFNSGFQHAVLLVGYDDNFSAENFTYQPPCDGAWLIKNSWGVDHGNNGYYWVSYYDFTIGEVCAIDTVSAEAQDHLYSYDDFGANGWFASNENGDESIFMSNIYTAKGNGFVTDVMYFNSVDGDQYEITVYTDLADDAVPTSGTAHGTTVGTASGIGYRTVTLDSPVHVSAGERFAVVAKMSGEQGYHVVCEYANNDHGQGVGFADFGYYTAIQGLENEERIMETFGAGQSFFSKDGQSWTDLYDSYSYDEQFLTGNICLRAITSDEGKIQFSSYSDALAPNALLSLSCADGTNIYYSVNGGAYSLYTAPIRFTSEMTVSAYAEGSEQNVYTRHYAEKKAVLSSLLIRTDYEAYYADLSRNDLDITLNWNSEGCKLLPIMSGTLTDGETEYDSSDIIELTCGLEPRTVTLTVQEDGLQPTEYQIHLSRECSGVFMEGIWTSRDNRTEWYYFSEDCESGYYVDRYTGLKAPFTYIVEGNSLTLNYEDSVRTAKLAMDDFNAFLQWDDGTEETLFQYCFGETSPYPTNPEMAELAAEYVAGTTGETPADIAVEIGDWGNVIITVTTEAGSEITYVVNEYNYIGKDQNNNVVNLNEIPEDTGITELKAGIWVSFDQGGASLYYYFGADGTVCEFNTHDGSVLNGTYTLANGQISIEMENDYSLNAAVKLLEDQTVFTWESGYIETKTYFSDQTPETFAFLSNRELSMLASAYYEAEYCRLDPFSSVFEDPEGQVYLYTESWDDFYLVDRFTGIGTDQDGNEVDLLHPTEAESTPIEAGIWRAGFMEWTDGYYWFSEDGKTALFKDMISGSVTNFTYRIVDGNGIADIDGEKSGFCIRVEFGDTMIHWPEPRISSETTEMITFVKEESDPNFKFYTITELQDMAVKDYESKHGFKAEISAVGFNSDGNAVIYLVNPETWDTADIYTVDPLTGIGTDQNGDEVNLPQTGISSASRFLFILAAFLLTGIGAGLIYASGAVRRKTDKT